MKNVFNENSAAFIKCEAWSESFLCIIHILYTVIYGIIHGSLICHLDIMRNAEPWSKQASILMYIVFTCETSRIEVSLKCETHALFHDLLDKCV